MKATPKLMLRLATLRRSIQHVLLSGFATPLAGAALGLHVATLVRGRNVSDVGVPMWERGDLAFAAGAASYLAVLAAGWYLGRMLADPIPEAAAALGWGVRLVMSAGILLAIRAAC